MIIKYFVLPSFTPWPAVSKPCAPVTQPQPFRPLSLPVAATVTWHAPICPQLTAWSQQLVCMKGKILFYSFRLQGIMSTTISVLSNARLPIKPEPIHVSSLCRYLIKSWQLARSGQSLTPCVAYLKLYSDGRQPCLGWENNIECLVKAFYEVAVG